MNISYELRKLKDELREAIIYYEYGNYNITIANLNHLKDDVERIKQEILKEAEEKEKK